MTKLTYSPWGKIQSQTELAPGIISVSTPSHGGIWLSPERMEQMKIKSTRYSSGGWYEEDCDWALVAVQFPEAFTERQQVAAKDVVARYFKESA